VACGGGGGGKEGNVTETKLGAAHVPPHHEGASLTRCDANAFAIWAVAVTLFDPAVRIVIEGGPIR